MSEERARPSPPGATPCWRAVYRTALKWSFSLFNAARLLTYLPTIWAINQSANSDQHSLLTWSAWAGANLTMALWLRERSARLDRASVINFGNAAMCVVTCVVILYHRA